MKKAVNILWSSLVLCLLLFICAILINSILINATVSRDITIIKNTPFTKSTNFKAGQLIKLKLIPDKSKLINCVNDQKCLFYQSNYYIYFQSDYRSGISIEKRPLKKDSKPGYLSLIDPKNNQKYTILTNKPEPEIFIKNEKTFILNKSGTHKEYVPTDKTFFEALDKTIEEKLILPEDEVIVIGRISKIDKHNRFLKLKLASNQKNHGNLLILGDSLNSFLNKKFSLFVVSTYDIKETEKRITQLIGLNNIITGVILLIVIAGIAYTLLA
ncbi:MAG: hypothetical protein AB1782_06280, partial [Cyanobacteriota bacterium]